MGYLSLDNFRTREWYDALDAAGIGRRGPYHLRHTFATEALAAGVSIFDAFEAGRGQDAGEPAVEVTVRLGE